MGLLSITVASSYIELKFTLAFITDYPGAETNSRSFKLPNGLAIGYSFMYEQLDLRESWYSGFGSLGVPWHICYYPQMENMTKISNQGGTEG